MCGPIIMRMLENPLDMLQAIIDPELTFIPQFIPEKKIGCSVTLAGYGYPFLEVTGPAFPITMTDTKQDIWLNEVKGNDQQILADGHRLLDVNGYGENLTVAIHNTYDIMNTISCSNSYYRNDIGLSLWPPGHD
jgi:phosphoribosylamine-glycine ligase